MTETAWSPDGPDLVMHGDNLPALALLPDASFRLIYIDPPFNTGRVQSRQALTTVRAEGGTRVGFQGRTYETIKGLLYGYDDAFAADTVHIIGRRRWNKRGAMVTDRYQHVMHHADVTAFVEWARSVDLPIVAIDNMEGAVLIETFDFPQRCVLLFGQEGPGLTAEALAASDVQVEISQFGSTRSLNASAAAAVAMHAWITQHASIPTR